MPSVSADQITSFQEDGYLILRGLFDSEEAGILRAAAQADQSFQDHAYDLEDGEGGKAQLVLWNSAGEDLWGAIARSERVVNAMEGLLGDEVYHYHSKMSIKQPRRRRGLASGLRLLVPKRLLFPDMGSAFIAVIPTPAPTAACKC